MTETLSQDSCLKTFIDTICIHLGLRCVLSTVFFTVLMNEWMNDSTVFDLIRIHKDKNFHNYHWRWLLMFNVLFIWLLYWLDLFCLCCCLLFNFVMHCIISTIVVAPETRKTFCRTRSLSKCNFFSFLITWHSSSSKSAAVYKISWKSDDFSLRYGDI